MRHTYSICVGAHNKLKLTKKKLTSRPAVGENYLINKSIFTLFRTVLYNSFVWGFFYHAIKNEILEWIATYD